MGKAKKITPPENQGRFCKKRYRVHDSLTIEKFKESSTGKMPKRFWRPSKKRSFDDTKDLVITFLYPSKLSKNNVKKTIIEYMSY